MDNQKKNAIMFALGLVVVGGGWSLYQSRDAMKPVDEVQKRQGRKPRTVGDFRRLVDDKEIDALVAYLTGAK